MYEKYVILPVHWSRRLFGVSQAYEKASKSSTCKADICILN
jgi:hypothetical protein